MWFAWIIRFVGPVIVKEILDYVLKQHEQGKTEDLGVMGTYLENPITRQKRVQKIQNIIKKTMAV
jgi:hypothetical protein